MGFRNRHEAGRQLAERLEHLRGTPVVVLGIPRGGVPVAYEVAAALEAPLDVILVRKLGVPFQPELAMGALGEDGIRVLNREVLRAARIDESDLAVVERREQKELARRAAAFRGGRERVPIDGRTAVVVDDGIATGSTASAACRVARAHGASKVVLAVPVAPPSSVATLQGVADEVVCLESPSVFFAVGQWYRDFAQTTDEEVAALLEKARRGDGATSHEVAPGPNSPVHKPELSDSLGVVGPTPLHQPGIDEEVTVTLGADRLAGRLVVPDVMVGFVLFAHGSGSSHRSPRNQLVSRALNEAGLGTFLVDLLTPAEAEDRSHVFDIPLLSRRLAAVDEWVREQPETSDVPIGLFGASTGAAAALRYAGHPDADIGAVVSRGGRPDLAEEWLARVRAPTLLVVGGDDEQVLQLNRRAEADLRCEVRLTVIPGATHLFAEPGALETVATLAREWFLEHLVPCPPPPPATGGN